MDFQFNLWTIIAGIMAVLVLLEMSSIKLIKRDATRREIEIRRDYLNRLNNLPGDEAEYVRFMNGVWSAMYDDPNSWEYPDQIIRHVNHFKMERDTAVTLICEFTLRGLHGVPFSSMTAPEWMEMRTRIIDFLDKNEPNWRNKQ